MPRMPSSMVCIRSTRPWWYTSETTPRPASHTYSSPCMSVRRMRLSTAGVDEWSMPKHTPHPQASPPTEPTIRILISIDQMTTTKIRCITAGRIKTIVPTLLYMSHRLNLLWRFKPKRTTSHHTSIMIMPCRTGTM